MCYQTVTPPQIEASFLPQKKQVKTFTVPTSAHHWQCVYCFHRACDQMRHKQFKKTCQFPYHRTMLHSYLSFIIFARQFLHLLYESRDLYSMQIPILKWPQIINDHVVNRIAKSDNGKMNFVSSEIHYKPCQYLLNKTQLINPSEIL